MPAISSYMKELILPWIGLLFSGMVLAQSTDTIAIAPVEVYSTGIRISPAESGRNVLIIPGNEIARHPGLSIDELLKYLPGIDAQSRGGFGVQSDFSIRGGTFSQVLVLIDGMRLNDPLTGHFNSYIPVAPSEIDHIEVLSGPAAGQYGPDAVGGVIQIITKTFLQDSILPSNRFEGKAMGGQYGLFHLQTGGGYSFNRTSLAGGVLWNRADGNPLPSGSRGEFDLRSASASVMQKLGNHSMLSYRTALDWRDFNAQYFYTASPADSSHERVSQWWNQMRVQRRSGNHEESLDLGWKQNHDRYVFNALSPANQHQTDNFQANLQETWTLGRMWRLQTGLQAQYMHITSSDRGNHKDHQAGVYLLGLVTPLPSLAINLGIRADNNPGFGTEVLPQASASYQKGIFVFRTSAGRSIRAADFTERFVSTHLPLVSALRNLGNPYLRAERAWNSEAGMDLRFSGNMVFSITAYLRNASNLIDYVVTNEQNITDNQNLVPGADYLYAQNISRLQTKGIESSFLASVNMGNAWLLKWRLGYTLQRSDNSEHIVSKYISSHAKQLLTAHLSLQRKRFLFQFDALWKQRNADFSKSLNIEQKPEYLVCNASLSADILKNRLFLTLQVNNIFDEHYSDILGAMMPGRWAMAGIRWAFLPGSQAKN